MRPKALFDKIAIVLTGGYLFSGAGGEDSTVVFVSVHT